MDIKCEVRMESIGMRNLPGEYGRWIQSVRLRMESIGMQNPT
jgi:hypothetical protein